MVVIELWRQAEAYLTRRQVRGTCSPSSSILVIRDDVHLGYIYRRKSCRLRKMGSLPSAARNLAVVATTTTVFRLSQVAGR